MADDGDRDMANIHQGITQILQSVEDALIDQEFDDITIATQNGSWRCETVARVRELSKPPEGAEPTSEEFDMAVRLIAASPQDHAKLSELIAREFARRRA